MTALVVTFDGTRVSAAENATDGGVWDKWNASQAPSVEPDFFYQGAACLSNKVGTTPGGVEMDQSTGTHDFSSPNRIWLAKVNATNYQALNAKGVDGMILYIGSQNTVDQFRYYVHGNDTYPLAGGWVFIPIDPNVAGYRDFTDGTPDLNNIDYFAVSCDFTSTSKSENVMMDAIDYFDSGTGLTVVSGTGGDPRATFADFLEFDQGTPGNRFGIIRDSEGIFYVLGVLRIGTGTRTAFTDTAQTLVFPDARCGAGWCGIKFDLANALTLITLTDCIFIGRGDAGGTADTRPDYTSSGFGNMNVTGGAFRVFRNLATTSGHDYTGVTFDQGLLINHVSNCAMDKCTFQNGTQGTNVAYIDSTRLGDFTDCTFQFNAGHAIRITSPGTYAFDGNLFTGAWGAIGSSDAMIFNDSGGLVTIDVGDGGTTVTYRNGAGASTVVNNNVILIIKINDEDGDPVETCQVAIYRVDDDTELMNKDTDVNGLAIESFNYSTDVDVYIRARKSSTGDTKYINASATGTIKNLGLDVTLILRQDGIVT